MANQHPITRREMSSSERQETNPNRGLQVLPDATIARLFLKMGCLFPVAWWSTFKTPEEIDLGQKVWARALAGIHPNQIGRALKSCSRMEFPPSTGTFLRMGIGLPKKTQAIERVNKRDCRDPLSAEIIRRISSSDFQSMSAYDLERKISRLYDDLIEPVMNTHIGDAFLWEPAKQIETKQSIQNAERSSDETKTKYLRRARATLGRHRKPDSGRDQGGDEAP